MSPVSTKYMEDIDKTDLSLDYFSDAVKKFIEHTNI